MIKSFLDKVVNKQYKLRDLQLSMYFFSLQINKTKTAEGEK